SGGGLEAPAEEAETVLEIERAPGVPAEDPRAVDEEHAPAGRLPAGIEKRADSRLHRPERRKRPPRRPGEPGADPAQQLPDDCAKEALLAVEVVVKGAAGHPRCRDDLLGGDAVEPALLEERPRGADQPAPRPPGSLRLSS